jgi:8-oxo-dGTP pyrophosphatase MutT (NUDIX family)
MLEANASLPIAARRHRKATDEATGGHAAGIAYQAPDGRVLLLKRSEAEQNYAGHWGLPGGKGEEGASPEETAAREASEELGGRAPDGKRHLLSSVRTPTGMTFHTFHQPVEQPFIPRLADGEHTAHAWRLPHDLPEPMHPRVAEAVRSLGMPGANDLAVMMDAEFNESDHPRAPDGKFGKGSGSGKKPAEGHGGGSSGVPNNFADIDRQLPAALKGSGLEMKDLADPEKLANAPDKAKALWSHLVEMEKKEGAMRSKIEAALPEGISMRDAMRQDVMRSLPPQVHSDMAKLLEMYTGSLEKKRAKGSARAWEDPHLLHRAARKAGFERAGTEFRDEHSELEGKNEEITDLLAEINDITPEDRGRG